jgi:hypothetical protein
MKREIEEIIISIDDKGDKVVFKRLKKSGSMEKMSMEELKSIVCGE